jgi:hypothetical protein
MKTILTYGPCDYNYLEKFLNWGMLNNKINAIVKN